MIDVDERSNVVASDDPKEAATKTKDEKGMSNLSVDDNKMLGNNKNAEIPGCHEVDTTTNDDNNNSKHDTCILPKMNDKDFLENDISSKQNGTDVTTTTDSVVIRRHRHRPDYNDMVERELQDMMLASPKAQEDYDDNEDEQGGYGDRRRSSAAAAIESADAIRNYGASILAMADQSRATRQQEKFRRSSSHGEHRTSSGGGNSSATAGPAAAAVTRTPSFTKRTSENSMISQSLRKLSITTSGLISPDNREEATPMSTGNSTPTTTKALKKKPTSKGTPNNTTPVVNKPTIVKLPPATPKQQQQQDDDSTSQYYMTPAASRDQGDGTISTATSMESYATTSSRRPSQQQQQSQQQQRRRSSNNNTAAAARRGVDDNDTTGIRRFKVNVNQETLESIRREQANLERQRQRQEDAAAAARGFSQRVMEGASTWLENRRERKRRAEMERKMEEANRALEEMRQHSFRETAQMIQRQSKEDITTRRRNEERGCNNNSNAVLGDDTTSMDVVVEEEPPSKYRSSPPILTKELMNEFATHYLPVTIKMGKWKRLYSLSRDGDSFETFINNVSKHSKTLLVVKTTREDIVGAYMESPWEVTHLHQEAAKFYGSGQSFLFKVLQPSSDDNDDDVMEHDVSFAPPQLHEDDASSSTALSPSTKQSMQQQQAKYANEQQHNNSIVVYRWTGINRYVQLCDGHRKCIAMGGGGSQGTFGLCLEDDFAVGSSGPCETFGNQEPLSKEETFDVLDVEVWGIFSYAF